MDFSSHFFKHKTFFYSSSARKKDFFINFHRIFYDKQWVIINCMKMRIFLNDVNKKGEICIDVNVCFPRQWFAEKNCEKWFFGWILINFDEVVGIMMLITLKNSQFCLQNSQKSRICDSHRPHPYPSHKSPTNSSNFHKLERNK